MKTATLNGVLTVDGTQMQLNISRTAIGGEGHEVPVPAGVAGELTNRTSDVAGIITLPDGHGFITNNIVAVFWADATTGAPRVVYGKIATVAGDAMTIADDVGGNYVGCFPAATVLPPLNTAVIVALKTVSNFSVLHSDVTLIACDCDQEAVGIFGAAASIYPVFIPVPLSAPYWDLMSGSTNPLATDPTKLVCYNGGLVAATFQYAVLLAT